MYIRILLLLITLSSSHIAAGSDPHKNQIIFAHLDWEPYIYQDAQGNSVGIFMDLMHEVFEKQLGMHVVSHLRPWKRAQLEVQQGKADAMITVATEKRLDYSIRSSQPIFPLYMTLFTYPDHPKLEAIKKIRTVRDIKHLNLTAVSNIGNGWHEANIQNQGITTTLVATDESVVKVVAHKRADIFIDVAEGMNITIDKAGVTDKIIQTEVRFGPTRFHLLMSKKSKHQHLMPKINAIIKKLWSEGTIKKIMERYSQ